MIVMGRSCFFAIYKKVLCIQDGIQTVYRSEYYRSEYTGNNI